ncbi:MAG TPA: YebC/PmpR family DNA-binding transcriptional regulator [Burkholderiales bacterium]|nr:YebC/PmpR family DNA-binding transcriptional regulator [Burkholderiales bacterium]
MAGHSKWKNIKFRKGLADAKRGKIFTKVIREITVAAHTGGGDPAHNPRLRTAVDKGLDANMTKDTIECAIQRGTGELEGASYDEVRYEGYGVGGVAVMVECTTDNRTRTVSEVRHAFTKHGGNLGQDGSVAFMFKRIGTLVFASGTNEDTVVAAALEAGADDIVRQADESIEVVTTPENFHAVHAAMIEAKLKPVHAEIAYRATSDIPLAGQEAEMVLKLIETLEDLDDVQNVYSNADIPDDMLVRHA